MSDRDPEPLPKDLADLLGPERKPGPAPGKERVRARVEATLFGLPGGGGSGPSHATKPSAASGVSNALRAGAIFVAGSVVGGVAVFAFRPARVEVIERVVSAPSAPLAESVTVALPIATHPTESPSASASPTASAPPSAPVDSLAQERTILDPARIAIGRGDGARALDAVHNHEARFPTGKLSEEREAIAVQALVLAHRDADARARGARFLARWPGSVLRPAVEAALAAAAPAPP
ncbi:MAG TPA: hypothetical protein VIF62_18570 [Labilithrix sp.]|jgi:hypothetical protein